MASEPTTNQPASRPDPADHVSRSLELLWAPPEPPSRGPKPGLTLDQIVSAAIQVADADGLDALSMRRVARELGVGTMSLYRYLPGKAELLDLMLDQVSGPGDLPERCQGAGWRTVLETTAYGARDLYRRHPWLLQVNWSRPVLGPNSVAGLEHVVAVLAGVGLSDPERITAVITLDAYVTGAVRGEIMHARVAEDTGVTDEEFWTRHYPFLEKAMATGDYPAMAALSEDAYNHGWDETFEWGLRRLLDGMETLITSRQR